MPARLPLLNRRAGNALFGLVPLSLALAGLAGCGAQSEDRFAPSCPQPSIPRDFNDMHRYRGAGRDLTDSVLEGRITGVNGTCKRDGFDTVVVTLSVAIELQRGPASPGRTADIGYFVAVSEGEDRILDKRVFRLRADFASNADRLRLGGDEVELRLPVTRQKTGASYRVSVGFELNPAELAENRRRGR